jgi:hypothetical protein
MSPEPAPFAQHAAEREAESSTGPVPAAKPGDDGAPTVWVTLTNQDGGEEQVEVDALDFARGKLHLPRLARLIRHGKTDPVFALDDAEHGRIELGPISKLRTPSHVADQVALVTGNWPWRPRRNGQWFHEIACALLAIQELEESDSTPEDITRQWVEEVARQWGGNPIDLDDPEQRAEAAANEPGKAHKQVFRTTDERLYVHAPSLDSYVRSILKIPGVTPAQITRRLAALGFESATVEGPWVEGPGDGERRKAKRRYWRSPPRFEKADDR